MPTTTSTFGQKLRSRFNRCFRDSKRSRKKISAYPAANCRQTKRHDSIVGDGKSGCVFTFYSRQSRMRLGRILSETIPGRRSSYDKQSARSKLCRCLRLPLHGRKLGIYTLINTGAARESASDCRSGFALQPDLPEGHLALGFSYYYGDRDYERALAGLRLQSASAQ